MRLFTAHSNAEPKEQMRTAHDLGSQHAHAPENGKKSLQAAMRAAVSHSCTALRRTEVHDAHRELQDHDQDSEDRTATVVQDLVCCAMADAVAPKLDCLLDMKCCE